MFSKALSSCCVENGLDRVRVEGCYTKMQSKLKRGLCGQRVHIWCESKAESEWSPCGIGGQGTKEERLGLILSPIKLGRIKIKSDECRWHRMCVCVCVCVCVFRRFRHVWLCNPVDHSPSVHGIFLARILEWVAVSSSKESSQPTDQTRVSCVSCITGGFFTC